MYVLCVTVCIMYIYKSNYVSNLVLLQNCMWLKNATKRSYNNNVFSSLKTRTNLPIITCIFYLLPSLSGATEHLQVKQYMAALLNCFKQSCSSVGVSRSLEFPIFVEVY